MGVWLDPRVGPFTRSRREICPASARTRKNFYNSVHRQSNITSDCCDRTVHKVVSYLTYAFAEDLYLNFDSLDYNALILWSTFTFLMTKTLFPFLQTQVAVKKRKPLFIYFIFSRIHFHRDQKNFKVEYSDTLKNVQCFGTEFVYYYICLIECT